MVTRWHDGRVTTIGITGGAGFIGGWIIDQLIADGYDVISFDHSDRVGRQGIERMLGDVRDATAVTELAAHVDGIIHMAAVLGTQETIGNPWPAAETNILGGINILNACRQYGLPLVYAGVGNHWMLNTYSTTKTAVERLLNQYRDEFGLRAATVRPVNAYGPRQRVAAPFGPGKVRKIVPAFACRALCGMPVEMYGTGEQVSDCVYVGDVARVFVRTLEACSGGHTPRLPIEVGSNAPAKVVDVARIIVDEAEKLTGRRSELTYLPMRPGEKDTPDVPAEMIEKLGHAANTWFGEGEATARVKRVLRTLGTEVSADLSTLPLVGIDPDQFVPLDEGLATTVAWYHATEGVEWEVPG